MHLCIQNSYLEEKNQLDDTALSYLPNVELQQTEPFHQNRFYNYLNSQGQSDL